MQQHFISARRATIATIAAAALSLPLVSVAQAEQNVPAGTTAAAAAPAKHCKYPDAPPSRRCLNFRSDTTFPEGLSDYHGAGGR